MAAKSTATGLTSPRRATLRFGPLSRSKARAGRRLAVCGAPVSTTTNSRLHRAPTRRTMGDDGGYDRGSVPGRYALRACDVWRRGGPRERRRAAAPAGVLWGVVVDVPAACVR